MAQTADDLEVQLLAQAQTAIRAMLAKKASEAITLTDIERMVGEMGKNLLQGMTQTLVDDAQQGHHAAVDCPECGQALHYKGTKPKQVVTVRGEVIVERAYYYCRRCGRGFFPPG